MHKQDSYTQDMALLKVFSIILAKKGDKFSDFDSMTLNTCAILQLSLSTKVEAVFTQEEYSI